MITLEYPIPCEHSKILQLLVRSQSEMTWSPADTTLLCAKNPTLPECQPAALAFLSFLVQYFGHSHDKHFTDSKRSSEELDVSYDFIIVGAGSAGCVLANRLSEVESWKVLLLEAGDEEPLIADVPSASVLSGSSIDYAYRTQPEPIACSANEDKSCSWPRGKVMGGSSSINGKMHVRGPRQDYDDWESLGNPGWSYKNVLPYFKKAEDLRIPSMAEKNPNTRGIGGPLTVGYFPVKGKHTEIILNGWKELGLNEIDYNDGNTMIGTSRTQFTAIHGARQSSNGAYIRPIHGRRSNLVIKTNAQVTKVIIDPKTKIAMGVEYITNEGKTTKRVFAKKEVILSAGAIDSPKLLMLSGIGPANELKEANIQVIKNLAVGKNLQDHFLVNAVPFGLNKNHSVIGDYQDAQNDLAYWLSNHEGLASGVGLFETTTFFQTQYETKPGVPDIQILFSGGMAGKPYLITSYSDHASLLVGLLNPKSRGEIKLNKTDPTCSPPLIYANYMTHQDDVNTIIAGLQKARKVFETKSFQEAEFFEERQPGCENYDYDSPEYWYCVSQRYSSTTYHPVGTCKMGPRSDPAAVVDSKLKVYGIGNLRVVDASIMPILVRGNTNAPTIMIGEKGSDMVKQQWL